MKFGKTVNFVQKAAFSHDYALTERNIKSSETLFLEVVNQSQEKLPGTKSFKQCWFKLVIATIWKGLLDGLYWQEIEPSKSIYHYHYMILPVIYLGRHLIHDRSNKTLLLLKETFFVICFTVLKWLVILKDKEICNFSFIIAKDDRKL